MSAWQRYADYRQTRDTCQHEVLVGRSKVGTCLAVEADPDGAESTPMTTPIPDGYELATWTRADGDEARDALIARITDETRATATFALSDGASLTLTNILTEEDHAGLRRIARWGVWFYLVNADSIAAVVVPVAGPAWASCRAVMDRDGDVWVRKMAWTGCRWKALWYLPGCPDMSALALARDYGPIRPLVDADGTKVLDEGEIDALAERVLCALYAYPDDMPREDIRTSSGYAEVRAEVCRLHGLGGAR